jgi:arylsulfatase A-like enzyme
MEMPEVPVGDWWEDHLRWHSPHNQCCLADRIPPHLLRRARAGYYGLITHIDAQIGRFLHALGGFGLARNTVICFTTDHGELLGDHHLFRKGRPYEGSARVPLILRAPAACGLKPNHACRHPVELRDVMPTLLDCAGLPVPDSVEGVSLLPLARGEEPEWRPYLHGEHAGGGNMMFLTDGHEKYVWFTDSGNQQLFDLDNDPSELHDLARKTENAGRLELWRQRLTKELEGREEGFTDGRQLLPGRPVSPLLSHLRQPPRIP